MGGGATRASNAVKGLTSAGCDVTVVAAFPHYPDGDIPRKYRFKPLSIEYSGKVKVVRTFVPPLASKGFANRLILFACFMASSLFAIPVVRRPKIVWTANPNIFAVFPAIIFRIAKRCDIGQNVDDLWPEEIYDLGMLKSPILQRLAGFIARVAYTASSVITPISPAYVDIIVGKYGVSREKVRVVPGGVDLQLFQYERPKMENSKFKVLYIGAFSLTYDFDQVLQVASLLEPYSDIEFVIQGGGELASQLKLKVAQLKLDNVRVIHRIISREEVARTLSEADVLLLPLRSLGSTQMAIATKLYEYQAAGKPIICVSGGRQARYVLETNSGIAVKPGDYKGLADAVLFLKSNPSVALELGKSGRKYVESNLSIETVGLKMKAVFNCVSAR